MDQTDTTRQKVTELMKKAKIGMLTTMTPEGKHHSRPMGLQETEFDGDLWFFTYEDSDKVHDVATNPEVNVAFSDQSSNNWISLSGRAEVVHDHDKAEELWSPLMKAWFPDGVDTEGLSLLKVHADSAEYWDSPNSKVVQLFGMVKSAITGTPPKAGDNQAVDF